ncbi:MAG: metallophosphoesterase [Ferruginibacter sp.]|uniref:metallophosphoesterase n=1 Tax=Ferruginibacter sp. TaxID=1940288 RepID=UPI00265A0CA4|nr:metallophosphoesterase [Ferruginibacter sp.]MDB5279760.1 metallophosphoesterase [Ferruginibacter sp.]
MRSPFGALIFIAIMLLLDTYVFQALKTVTQSASPRTKTIVYAIYWTISAVAIIAFLLFSFSSQQFLPRVVRTYMFATVLGLFLAKFAAVLFFFTDDIRRGIQWIAAKIFQRNSTGDTSGSDAISRSVFLSWMGLGVGSTLFGSLVYGFGNKYKYDVKRVQMAFDNLPAGFKGMKILHISDIHSGSFTDKQAVLHGVNEILKEKADVILFTGDLVNDRATEMDDYMDVFSQLKAPMGVYSTLGNHDYGDYVSWPDNGVTKEQNLENLKGVHAKLGWKLLMNEHVVLERNDHQIALIGIENWSNKARFPKHGRMDLAYPGAEKYPFKILMSHDPSHWDAQVKPHYPAIDLMLSGHTHGMQFGVDIPGFKWSPVQYMYKEWAGLYEETKQKLYVNRGFGFIGYPGRVGILPEITVIELV